MKTINERSFAEVTVVCEGTDGTLVIPASMQWRLDDLTNQREVRGWTSIIPASRAVITIPATDNNVLKQTERMEKRCITVKVNGGEALEANEKAYYLLKNLYGVT